LKEETLDFLWGELVLKGIVHLSLRETAGRILHRFLY